MEIYHNYRYISTTIKRLQQWYAPARRARRARRRRCCELPPRRRRAPAARPRNKLRRFYKKRARFHGSYLCAARLLPHFYCTNEEQRYQTPAHAPFPSHQSNAPSRDQRHLLIILLITKLITRLFSRILLASIGLLSIYKKFSEDYKLALGSDASNVTKFDRGRGWNIKSFI